MVRVKRGEGEGQEDRGADPTTVWPPKERESILGSGATRLKFKA